jgi:hypothetical protein
MKDTKMEGMLTIKMSVTLPTTTPRRKRVVLAKSWCSRYDAEDELGKWFNANQYVDPQLLTVEWIAQETIFVGSRS